MLWSNIFQKISTLEEFNTLSIPPKTNRMLRKFIFLGFVWHSISLIAQTDSCDCAANFSTLQRETEANYAGFPMKVTPQTQKAYQELVNQLGKATATVTQPKQCYDLLASYIHFFKDKHFILSYIPSSEYPWGDKPITESVFKKQCLQPNRHAIEGIWTHPDGKLTLGIQRENDTTFTGIVLSSQEQAYRPGMVYVQLTVTLQGYVYQNRESFITTPRPARQIGNLLQLWSHEMWGKIFPQTMNASERIELETWKNQQHGLRFEKLSNKTAWIKIPTFLNNEETLQNWVQQNDAAIKSCENLIIDLTGNGGGSSGWVSLIPYLLTQPIHQRDTYVRVTPANVHLKRKDLEFFATQHIPEAYQKYFPEATVQAYRSAYEELTTTKLPFYPIPGVTFPMDVPKGNPKKVALIVDGFGGSSTEYFFYLSQQSEKTRRFGTPTYGMMDYEGMSTPTPLPFSSFYLTIPIVKSHWTDTAPIDQTGFIPEYRLDQLPPETWVTHVKGVLEKE